MIADVNKKSCFDTKVYVKKGDLLIANTSEFNLTEGRVYVAVKNQGEESFGDSIWVTNDKNEKLDYSSEYFCHYEGELVSCDL
jgi:hypothetical protein